MTIKRTVNGIVYEFELTNKEWAEFDREHDHIVAVETVDALIDVDEYGLTAKELDEIAELCSDAELFDDSLNEHRIDVYNKTIDEWLEEHRPGRW